MSSWVIISALAAAAAEFYLFQRLLVAALRRGMPQVHSTTTEEFALLVADLRQLRDEPPH